MNPPGSVIRIADEPPSGATVAPLNGPGEGDKVPNCIMSVDYETGSINLIRGDLRESVPENPLNNGKYCGGEYIKNVFFGPFSRLFDQPTGYLLGCDVAHSERRRSSLSEQPFSHSSSNHAN